MILKAKYRLDAATIARILRLKTSLAPEGATTLASHATGETESMAAVRRTELRWIMAAEHPFAHQALADVVREHQARMGVREPLHIERGVQLATYHPGDHYDWHEDGHPDDATRRRLSISVLLTDDFEGGEMEFRRAGAPRLRKSGDIVLFDAWETHRVAPVTRGVRDSLVVWFRVS